MKREWRKDIKGLEEGDREKKSGEEKSVKRGKELRQRIELERQELKGKFVGRGRWMSWKV